MGTSTSSRGSPGGAPLIPPWVPPVPPIPPDELPDAQPPDPEPALPKTPDPQPYPDLAPEGRFFGARLRLGQYAKNGSKADLRAGLKAYANKGLGGPQRAAARMAGTSQTAGRLYEVLASLSQRESLPPELGLDAAALSGRDAKEIGDVIAEAIRPSDGTLDADASRDAIAQAVCDLVEETPDVDLT